MTRRNEGPGPLGFRMRAWLGPELVAFILSVIVILTALALVATGVLRTS